VQELAYQYTKKGACLSLVARRKQALEGVAADVSDVLVIPADISDAEQSRRAVEAIVAHFGKRTRPSLYPSSYRPIRLTYKPYLFSQRIVFFSHNKSANGTFSPGLSAKRTVLLVVILDLVLLSDHVCVIVCVCGSVNHLVANAGVWSSCFFDEITNITGFNKMMVNQIYSYVLCTMRLKWVTFLTCTHISRM